MRNRCLHPKAAHCALQRGHPVSDKKVQGCARAEGNLCSENHRHPCVHIHLHGFHINIYTYVYTRTHLCVCMCVYTQRILRQFASWHHRRLFSFGFQVARQQGCSIRVGLTAEWSGVRGAIRYQAPGHAARDHPQQHPEATSALLALHVSRSGRREAHRASLM